jgi:hypothetical protein
MLGAAADALANNDRICATQAHHKMTAVKLANTRQGQTGTHREFAGTDVLVQDLGALHGDEAKAALTRNGTGELGAK